MGTNQTTRQWQDLNLQVADGVRVLMLTQYRSTWNHLLNGDDVEKETGIKFKSSLIFDHPSITAPSLEHASEMLISRIRDYHSRLFSNSGVYLMHIRVEPSSRDPELSDVRYTPCFYVQALVDVSGGPEIIH